MRFLLFAIVMALVDISNNLNPDIGVGDILWTFLILVTGLIGVITYKGGK